MKRKLLARLLAATLVFTVLPCNAMDMTSVQAAETESEFYTSGEVTDENGNTEICVGDYLEVTAGVYRKSDDSALSSEQWDFYSDEELHQLLGEDKSLTFYTPNLNDDENGIVFDGCVPEAAFGQYVSKFYATYVNEQESPAEWAYSKGTVHSWGGTENITFSENVDGKTVTVYSIYKNKSNNAKIPSKIVVANKNYKVTQIGDYALDNKDIKSVTIPSSVTSIGKEAFNKASKLKTITIRGNLTRVGKNAFAGINKKAVFKIKASASGYKKTVKLIKKAGAPKTVTFKRIK